MGQHYLGWLGGSSWEVFRSSKTPTKKDLPFYHRVVGPFVSEQLARRGVPKGGILKNPATGELDRGLVIELESFITSDADLYRAMHSPIILNLMKKRNNGTYDSTKAVKLFMYLADEGAKRYNEQHGDGTRSMKLFDKPTRLAVAQSLTESFEGEAELGNYDTMTPKKNPASGYDAKAAAKRIHTLLRSVERGAKRTGGNAKGIAAIRKLIEPKKNPALTIIGNPPSLYNIEKSAFKRGEYVGYSDGVWRIFKWNATTWRAVKRDGGGDYIDAPTLSKLSELLTLKLPVDKQNPPTGDLMSDNVIELRYIHRGDGAPYKHEFESGGVRMRANADGTITLYHPTKRIHEEFPE
jgi:hypothetical protein